MAQMATNSGRVLLGVNPSSTLKNLMIVDKLSSPETLSSRNKNVSPKSLGCSYSGGSFK